VDQMGAAKIPGFSHTYIAKRRSRPRVAPTSLGGLQSRAPPGARHRCRRARAQAHDGRALREKDRVLQGKGGSMHIAGIDLGISARTDRGRPAHRAALLRSQPKYLETDKYATLLRRRGLEPRARPTRP